MSRRQSRANRLDAQKSTGPRTPEGKAAVRFNALKHALRAEALILPGESAEEFDQLRSDLEADWQPHDLAEQRCVQEMAVSWWKQDRLELSERNALREGDTYGSDTHLLDRIAQTQSRLKRDYYKRSTGFAASRRNAKSLNLQDFPKLHKN